MIHIAPHGSRCCACHLIHAWSVRFSFDFESSIPFYFLIFPFILYLLHFLPHFFHFREGRNEFCALRLQGYGFSWRLLLPHRSWAQRQRPQGDLGRVLHRVPDPLHPQFSKQGFLEDVEYDDTALVDMLREAHRLHVYHSQRETCLSVSRRRRLCPRERVTCWRANGATCWTKWSGAKRWTRTD